MANNKFETSKLKLPSGQVGSIDFYIERSYNLNAATLQEAFPIAMPSKTQYIDAIKTTMRENMIDVKEAIKKYGRGRPFVSGREQAWMNIRKQISEAGLSQKLAARIGKLSDFDFNQLTWDPDDKMWTFETPNGTFFIKTFNPDDSKDLGYISFGSYEEVFGALK